MSSVWAMMATSRAARAVGAGKHTQGPDLLPKGAAPRRIELDRRGIGGEPFFETADAITRGERKILDPNGGDRGVRSRDVLVGELRGERSLQMHGAGDFERHAEAKRHQDRKSV